MTRQEQVQALLADAEKLLTKKPFYRGGPLAVNDVTDGKEVNVLEAQRAVLPRVRRNIISQERFLKELDPASHDVIFDENMPSICVKGRDGSLYEVKHEKCSLSLQQRLREKKTLTMCGNKTIFNLLGTSNTEQDIKNFAAIKESWEERNMDGMRTKAVYTQLGMGDSGLLFYFNHKGEVRCRLLTYEDGYVLITHKDANGEPLLDCVYYSDENGVEYIDCYDDTYMYRLSSKEGAGEDGWTREAPVKHNFSESPLCTKRGDVAWNNTQNLISILEILYNVFVVIQKRHGWGILYIRGRINETMKKIAGSVVLQDTSLDGNGTAEFKAPPSPQGMFDTIQSLYEQIQINEGATFLLPKDIKSSGDISALAIMLTQSLDLESAETRIIEWQNFLRKMKRLFVEGIAKEHTNNGTNKNAVTEYAKLRIATSLKPWRPFNENEYNVMIATLKGAGIISSKTAIEKNTLSAPDEEVRIQRELEQKKQQEQEAQEKAMQNNNQNQNVITNGENEPTNS